MMTAKELLLKQIDELSYQLDQLAKNLPSGLAEARLSPTGFSYCEQYEHLCEVYTALDSESKGIKHSWGTYSIEDKSWDNVLSTYRTLRSRAREVAESADSDKVLLEVSAYIVTHDGYHIGQLAAIRLAHDPEWDPFSIYQH